MVMFFVLSFFPRGVLDEILNLIESVSEGFPSYSFLTALIDLCFKGEILKYSCLLFRRYFMTLVIVYYETATYLITNHCR